VNESTKLTNVGRKACPTREGCQDEVEICKARLHKNGLALLPYNKIYSYGDSLPHK